MGASTNRLPYLMIIEHKRQNEAGFVNDYASVKQYACLTCINTGASFRDAAPFCNTCQRYMVQSGFVKESSVVEIKNRKAKLDPNGSDKKKKGRKGRAEDNLIQRAVWGKVQARSGGPSMGIAVNMNDEMFMRGSVAIKWGEVSFMTNIYEIGAAFTPFDSSPTRAMKEDGIDMTTGKPHFTPVEIPAPIKKQTMTLGPLTIQGGYSRKAFDDMFAIFTWGSQRAVFCMSDICQVIKPALLAICTTNQAVRVKP